MVPALSPLSGPSSAASPCLPATVLVMADLPAHVKFPPNGDGWVVIDGTDVITSVQAFVDGPELVIELGPWANSGLCESEQMEVPSDDV